MAFPRVIIFFVPFDGVSFFGGGAVWTSPPLRADQLATFYKLVDKRTIAGVFCRHACYAELSARASTQAEALFGDDSLVVEHLRYNESEALVNLIAGASAAEREALYRRSWAALVFVVNLLLRRIEANTLLPGTLRAEELDYHAHVQTMLFKATNEPPPSAVELRRWEPILGYKTLLHAVYRSLDLLGLQIWPTVQRKVVESFVLRGLDVIPQTAGTPAHLINCEDILVVAMENINPRSYDPTFYAAVCRKWQSNAVSSVLRARNVLQTGFARAAQSQAEFLALQRADVAKHGLRDCALPSCFKTEKTVKEFAGCSGCCTVVYCLKHQALDWKAHKKACREMEAARLAEEEAEEEGAGAAKV